MGTIKQNQTELSKILDAAKGDMELYTRGRGSESGLRNQWLKNNGVRESQWQPSKSELETWTEDYVKAGQELRDAQKALKRITPTEGVTLDDAQKEYGTARIAAQQRVDDAQDELDEWYEKPLLQELFLLNKLPGAKDIISLLTGDDVSRMDLEGAKNLIKAWQIMSECLKLATGKLEEQDAQYGNMTGYGKLANVLKGISQFTGLPLYNATRDVVAVWNTILSNVTGVKLTVYMTTSHQSSSRH